MFRNFRNRGIEHFFREGSKAGIDPQHARRLRLQLGRLDEARSAQDLLMAGRHWHELKGDMKGYRSVSVSGNWRLIFTFAGTDAANVNYLDYH